jgi:hypothetical protein
MLFLPQKDRVVRLMLERNVQNSLNNLRKPEFGRHCNQNIHHCGNVLHTTGILPPNHEWLDDTTNKSVQVLQKRLDSGSLLLVLD